MRLLGKVLLNINPNVTSITEILGVTVNITPKIFRFSSIIPSFGTLFESGISLSFINNK